MPSEERKCEERLLDAHDRLCVIARNNARLHEELAGINRQLAEANQRIGDLIHEVEHHKYISKHATELLESERAGNRGRTEYMARIDFSRIPVTRPPEPTEGQRVCPVCGNANRCSNCQAHETDCRNIELQCGIEVSLYTIGGIDFGKGYCSDFACRCGHEEKVR